jgi:hypothetical protein
MNLRPSLELAKQPTDQSQNARMATLNFMSALEVGPRKELDEKTPRACIMTIDPSKIGAGSALEGKGIKVDIAPHSIFGTAQFECVEPNHIVVPDITATTKEHQTGSLSRAHLDPFRTGRSVLCHSELLLVPPAGL